MLEERDRRILRAVEEAVAAAVPSGRFPDPRELRLVAVRAEAAAQLAELPGRDPAVVYVVGCSRALDPLGAMDTYVTRGRRERTLARADEGLALIAEAAGIRREEALRRLELIRQHLEALPAGAALAACESLVEEESSRGARLRAACGIALEEDADGWTGL